MICKNIQEIVYIYYDSYEFNIFEAIKKKKNMLKCYSTMQSPSSFIDELLENLNVTQDIAIEYIRNF